MYISLVPCVPLQPTPVPPTPVLMEAPVLEEVQVPAMIVPVFLALQAQPVSLKVHVLVHQINHAIIGLLYTIIQALSRGIQTVQVVRIELSYIS